MKKVTSLPVQWVEKRLTEDDVVDTDDFLQLSASLLDAPSSIGQVEILECSARLLCILPVGKEDLEHFISMFHH